MKNLFVIGLLFLSCSTNKIEISQESTATVIENVTCFEESNEVESDAVAAETVISVETEPW